MSDDDTDHVPDRTGNRIEPQHMLGKYLPAWDAAKAAQICWTVVSVLAVGVVLVRGLGPILGYFQPACQRPHVYLTDEEQAP